MSAAIRWGYGWVDALLVDVALRDFQTVVVQTGLFGTASCFAAVDMAVVFEVEVVVLLMLLVEAVMTVGVVEGTVAAGLEPLSNH